MNKKTKLSVAIATFNEAENIKDCLDSIKDIADEIVLVDGGSLDQTQGIAKKFDAKIFVTDNPPIFHINKQKAFDLSTGDWILNLDADERVSKKLGEEILNVINLNQQQLSIYQQNLKKRKLFIRHQKIVEERDGKIGEEFGDYNAFFVPRLNFFLGKFLKYGGVYPDGVIRLFKKNKAYLPCRNVHEQLVVDGRVGWLENDLTHIDSKTFNRYLARNNRYVDLMVGDFKKAKLKIDLWSFLTYMLVKPLNWFLLTSLRNKGIFDGYQGLVFSFFSALRFPKAYLKYLKQK